jgi:hypothetical protein
VIFLFERVGKPSQLAAKSLDMIRDASKPFNGEEQIEKTLASNPSNTLSLRRVRKGAAGPKNAAEVVAALTESPISQPMF